MLFYITIGTIQDYIEKCHSEEKKRPLFPEIIKRIYQDKNYQTSRPNPPDFTEYLACGESDFARRIRNLSYAFQSEELFSDHEYDLVPEHEDITTVSEFWGTKEIFYESDCFEIYYVLSGRCKFQFLDETRILEQGNLCILAPHSRHNISLLSQTSFLVPILVKEQAFERAFFSLLSDKDILSRFFHSILQNPEKPNYLLFYASESLDIQRIVRLLFLERFHYDQYASRCGIYWLNLLFANVLRSYETYFQFSYYEKGPDHIPLLRYIQSHYRTVTMKELSQKFHYTIPYMSKTIHSLTGETFSGLVLRLRMNEAERLLRESSDTIETIAKKTGYNSADHFSRSFKKFFHQSPRSFRMEAKTKERN